MKQKGLVRRKGRKREEEQKEEGVWGKTDKKTSAEALICCIKWQMEMGSGSL